MKLQLNVKPNEEISLYQSNLRNKKEKTSEIKRKKELVNQPYRSEPSTGAPASS